MRRVEVDYRGAKDAADAWGTYEPGAVLRAIYRDDEPVGVLLVEVEGGTPYLVRFMVDAAHQRRGVGRQAVELLVDELRAAGWSSLETSLRGCGRVLAPLWL